MLLIPTVMVLKMEMEAALATMPTLGIQFAKSTVALWLIVLAQIMEMELVSVTKVMNGSQEITSTNAEGQIVLLIPTVMELKMETEAVLVTMPILGIQSASLIALILMESLDPLKNRKIAAVMINQVREEIRI